MKIVWDKSQFKPGHRISMRVYKPLVLPGDDSEEFVIAVRIGQTPDSDSTPESEYTLVSLKNGELVGPWCRRRSFFHTIDSADFILWEI